MKGFSCQEVHSSDSDNASQQTEHTGGVRCALGWEGLTTHWAMRVSTADSHLKPGPHIIHFSADSPLLAVPYLFYCALASVGSSTSWGPEVFYFKFSRKSVFNGALFSVFRFFAVD